ncbi:hypothetical protein [Kibdelosporangium phytohabitans]|uniref:Uncharacterized protein n=1 Tax=Kibdelosporangium phytohabitans TaxID=860235 RepID=A0A0N9I1J9_9PSEU|nr:hypothetical protein [Kibdelosporangium phytohabitans]ALG12366.1 hypothetical protein AOZ06_40825 [Kibdelosporangium phytohabitans]MBE1463938.1 hypothetical protein [Kibdelosporangium phytohabitans]
MARGRLIAPDKPAEMRLDVDGWRRRGGHRRSVHVTTEEFVAAVHAGLPDELGPWHLTGSDSGPGADGRRECRAWAEDDVSLDRHGRTPSGHRANMWIWSSALTESHPPLSGDAAFETWCSYNGFLLVQSVTEDIWRPSAKRPTSRDISVVDGVHTATGELIAHPHYLSVWRRIDRRLRKAADQPGPAYGHPLCDGTPGRPPLWRRQKQCLPCRPAEHGWSAEHVTVDAAVTSCAPLGNFPAQRLA